MIDLDIISAFFLKVAANPKIGTTHIGLFMALLHCWKEQQCQLPFNISRSRLMKLAKIKSTSTYHICIKDLKECLIINYEPSFHPVKGTCIRLNIFIGDKRTTI